MNVMFLLLTFIGVDSLMVRSVLGAYRPNSFSSSRQSDQLQTKTGYGCYIKDPTHRFSHYQKQEMCVAYHHWGREMLKDPPFHPTDTISTWWQSLGLGYYRNRHHGFFRGKRQTVRPRVRKEYRTLTTAERRRFHAAVNALKNERMDGMSKYDIFQGYHQASMAPGAHFGPAFYGWHRELLLR